MSGEIKVTLILADGSTREVSEAFSQIRNLVDAANYHVQRGCDKDCTVSVTQLRRTAHLLKILCAPVSEWTELELMIGTMPRL